MESVMTKCGSAGSRHASADRKKHHMTQSMTSLYLALSSLA